VGSVGSGIPGSVPLSDADRAAREQMAVQREQTLVNAWKDPEASKAAPVQQNASTSSSDAKEAL